MTKKKTNEEIREENVASTVSATENFFIENKKLLWGILIAVLVAGLGFLGYNKLIYAPAVEEAQQECYLAELNFLQTGDYELALNGDGATLGFAQICDKYGAKAGKAVYLYAGICCAQLSQWEDALFYLKKYNGKDEILAARALALQGDCHLALGEKQNALNCYVKAAGRADNLFAADYLVKAAKLYVELGQKEKALAAYNTVKDKYPMSIEASYIDKYINEIAE